jgi:uncharacterized membrane protein
MIGIIILSIWLISLLVVSKFTYTLHHQLKSAKAKDDESLIRDIKKTQDIVYTCVVLMSAMGAGIIYYFFVQNTIYESHFFEWANLLVRWIHITFGIAWIGASFYFVFLENSLNRTKNVRDELAGNLWAIHGGGFYYLEKYKLAPKEIPKDLHWFKYEAYFTWLSGFTLLFVVYYFNAKSYLIDTSVMDLTPLIAVAIGVGSLLFGWIIYDLMCKYLKQGYLFLAIGILFLIGFAWFYSSVFSARAAYIHFGALLGTIMAANVFFVIIPGQKAMVEAAKKGLLPSAQHAIAAGMRSYHNNYFTLPVLFVMISNHFPSTFGNDYQWIVLLIISFGSAGIKHYLNLREKEQLSVWVLPISIALLLTAAFVTAPQVASEGECTEEVKFEQVQAIIQTRCITCHSEKPTDDIWKAAPSGVKFDTPEQIMNMKDKIFQRVTVSKDMPFNNNQTKMTDEERKVVECWINQGAKGE